MKYLILFTLSFVVSCQREIKGLRDIHPGSTSMHEALQILEDPKHITRLQSEKETQIFHWQEFDLQIEDKLVQAIVRKPNTIEKDFLYWRHSYRQTPTKLQKINDSDSYQLLIPSEGLAIIYDGQIDEVTKVVRYEAP